MYGGTITSVLINTPGESASVVTCIDGYQMALQGRAGPALGIAAIGSFIAGTVGVVLLMLMSPLLARWALVVRPARDLRAHAARAHHRHRRSPATTPLKGYISMVLGLMLSMVGFDIISGDAALHRRHHRDAGRHRLPAGGHRPVRHGRGAGRRRAAAGGSEHPERALRPARRAAHRRRLGAQPVGHRARHRARLRHRHPARRRARPSPPSSPTRSRRRSRGTRRSSATAPSRAWRRPESANNAASAGAMVPMLTLGIPGSATTAVMLGGLMMWGLAAGAAALREEPGFRLGPHRLAVHRQRDAADPQHRASSRSSCARCAIPYAHPDAAHHRASASPAPTR